jgi:Enterobacteriaceae phage serine recombinase
MIIGYARLSPGIQTPIEQLRALKRAKCRNVYVDEMIKPTVDRPELTRCLTNLKAGDALVVWRLDRLALSLRDLLEIVNRLNLAGIDFYSITESIDTRLESGRLFYNYLEALAHFEKQLMSERTKVGLEAARTRGRLGGRKHKLTKEQMFEVKRIWATGSRSRKSIAELFNISLSTVERITRPQSLKE